MSLRHRQPIVVRLLGLSLLILASVSCEVQRTDESAPRPTMGVRDSASEQPSVSSANELEVLATVDGFQGKHYRADIQSELQHLDPSADDWDTEAFNEVASSQLKRLAESIRNHGTGSERQIAVLADEQFSSTPLRPDEMQPVFQDAQYSAWRYEPSDSVPLGVEHHGPAGLQAALDELRGDVQSSAPLDFHFKIVRVHRMEHEVESLVFVELATRSQQRIVQQTARWNCTWTDDLAEPKLLSIRLSELEEVQARHRTFADDTATVLAGNRSYAEQLIFGFDAWRQSLDWRFGIEVVGPHGLSLADVNGDGLDDVFYCETGGLPNRLFVQQPDGTATDQSAASGLDFLEPTHSALFVDLDNDGDQDAILAVGRFVLFLQNHGTGQFSRQAIHSTSSMARSMSAADYDLDGDLDIYVCGYFPRDAVGEGVGLGRPMPYHDANNGVANQLLANQGDWNFVDVTDAIGLDQNNRRFSYAASWDDYDNDGDPDLYVANDFGRNNLYRNDGGTFVDVAHKAGVEDMSAGMSVSWGDYDRDGNMDIYVGNMFSSAGNRITYQRRFRDDEVYETRSKYQRHARGNTLFRNRGDGTFDDVSEVAAVTMGRWSWSSSFVDLNNDGWDDLLVGNGMVTSADDPGDL